MVKDINYLWLKRILSKVNSIKWNSEAKKDGFQTGDIISEYKIENLDRPKKSLVYPFAFSGLLFFGYLNYKRRKNF